MRHWNLYRKLYNGRRGWKIMKTGNLTLFAGVSMATPKMSSEVTFSYSFLLIWCIAFIVWMQTTENKTTSIFRKQNTWGQKLSLIDYGSFELIWNGGEGAGWGWRGVAGNPFWSQELSISAADLIIILLPSTLVSVAQSYPFLQNSYLPTLSNFSWAHCPAQQCFACVFSPNLSQQIWFKVQ